MAHEDAAGVVREAVVAEPHRVAVAVTAGVVPGAMVAGVVTMATVRPVGSCTSWRTTSLSVS